MKAVAMSAQTVGHPADADAASGGSPSAKAARQCGIVDFLMAWIEREMEK